MIGVLLGVTFWSSSSRSLVGNEVLELLPSVVCVEQSHLFGLYGQFHQVICCLDDMRLVGDFIILPFDCDVAGGPFFACMLMGHLFVVVLSWVPLFP